MGAWSPAWLAARAGLLAFGLLVALAGAAGADQPTLASLIKGAERTVDRQQPQRLLGRVDRLCRRRSIQCGRARCKGACCTTPVIRNTTSAEKDSTPVGCVVARRRSGPTGPVAEQTGPATGEV